MKPRITFKRVPHERLVSVGQERGWHCRVGGKRVGSVGYARIGGWGWSATIGTELRNSWAEGIRYDNPEDAKEACRAYVEAFL